MRKDHRTEQRTYLRTHPWIKFRVNLAESPPGLWIMLGECQSKCEHIASVPLRPDTAEKLHKIYLAKGILATTAIEGNTLSEGEVRLHLDGKLTVPPSRNYLKIEIDNILKICNRLLKEVATGSIPEISVDTICALNRGVLQNLEVDEEIVPGQIRRHAVGVGRYASPPAGECLHLLQELCDWLNSGVFKAEDPRNRVTYAIIKAVLAHLYIAWIHPFGDGNGRTARLLEFQILISSGVPAPAAHLLSNHYNLTRSEYYRQLDRASKSGGEVIPFITYAVQGFMDGLQDQLATIRKQVWDVTWRNYIHEMFRDKQSATQVRRRHLILDLSRSEAAVRISQLPDLSARLARAYSNKTRKTLVRDLHALMDLGLIEKVPQGYRAKRELILRFLPQVAGDSEKG